MKAAISKFEDAVATLDEINIDLGGAINEAASLIASGDNPLDKTLITGLETAISEAKAAKISVPEMPDSIEEIINKADEIYSIDYTDVIANLNAKYKDLEISIQRFELVNHPDEAYIIDCLRKVPSIIDVSAVTEETDPMNNINKAGWYTAHVYFSSCDVDQSEVYGDSLIDKGTDAGGSIEVYKTVEEAEKRNEYLASFDGGTLASGSHIVVGTCVVRTSDELTATEQNNLETDIVATLVCLPQDDIEYLTKEKKVEQVDTKPTEVQENVEEDYADDSYQNYVPEPIYPSVVGTYYYDNYEYDCEETLTIFADGTFYLNYVSTDPENGDVDLPLEGTWTQDGDTYCYNVWCIDGFEFNNPFYDTVYYDGIDFLGNYYARIN